MRSTRFVAALVVWSWLGLVQIAAAQTAPDLTIHNVTLREDTGVLTITGTGFGRQPVVTVDGAPVAVLSGATETQIEVLAPAALLTTPGSYRLTVMDAVRQIGEAFVVTTSPMGRTVGTVKADASSGSATAEPDRTRAAAPVDRVASAQKSADVSPNLVEGATNTAVGVGVLLNNTTGANNTATGAYALYSNTTGSSNTASGFAALLNNTTGTRNTASGYGALSGNTTGERNMAAGYRALAFNSIGSANTASGVEALYSNTSGSYNAAAGTYALNQNTTGAENTATGYAALFQNTSGSFNVASGTGALYANTTGRYNTASGYEALRFAASGTNNVATGVQSLYANVTGNDNTATGTSALYYSTASFNTAHGTAALYNLTSGASNTALGNRAGLNATSGWYNVYVGAGVWGTAADTNTMRLGLAYDGASGQNRTFIAGIYGTALSSPGQPVYIDATGQLGTMQPPLPPPAGGGGGSGSTGGPTLPRTVQTALDAQQAGIATLEAALVDMRERLATLEGTRGR